MHNRRHFLLHCSAGAVAACLPPVLGSAIPSNPRFEDFRSCLDSVFQVGAGGRQFPLVLVEATLRPARVHPRHGPGPDAMNEKFSLCFRGPASARLAQGIHRMEHERLGTQEIFLTPVLSPNPAQPLYEAVFNRPCPV